MKEKDSWWYSKFTNEATHVFIIRIWFEPREDQQAEPVMRGALVNAKSNEKISFDHVDTVANYLTAFLDSIRENQG